MKLLNKFKNTFIFLACFLVYFRRGKADTVPQEPKRIVVLRWTPYIGDVVYTTPLFAAIKERFPESKVTLVGAGRVEEVVRHNPNIDEFISYDGNFWKTVRLLRKREFDFGCVAKPGTSEGFALLYLSGVKAISLFDVVTEPRVKSATYPLMLKLGIPVPFRNHEYIPPQFLTLLRPLGITNPNPHFKLYFSADASNRVREALQEAGIDESRDFIVGIAPGGSTKERWWPAENFAGLARILVERHGAKLVVLGSPRDAGAVAAFLRHLADVNVFDACKQNLDEFKTMVSLCSLAIGNDSGLMVSAEAFDVPHMVFVGPTDPKEFHPKPGPTHRVLAAPSGRVEDISLEEAVRELESLLAAVRARKS